MFASVLRTASCMVAAPRIPDLLIPRPGYYCYRADVRGCLKLAKIGMNIALSEAVKHSHEAVHSLV